ncbi:hypothetical protein [Streptomyces sp. bgisy159]|uniref:hypothetical protein n=1 Tax=Streptomyces sp. bgisy159 TaxID=3413795 RepID=UPI003F4A3D64
MQAVAAPGMRRAISPGLPSPRLLTREKPGHSSHKAMIRAGSWGRRGSTGSTLQTDPLRFGACIPKAAAGGSMPPRANKPTKNDVGYFDIAHYGAAIENSTGGVYHVKLNAYARQDTSAKPFAVVNDFVASSLGMAAGLPVPPGNLVGLYGGKHGYVSLAFGDRGDRPPPVIPPKFCAERPWEACGIIAFDHWILNTDRHDENLAYLPDVGVSVFDHDRTLINQPPDGDAIASLSSGKDIAYKTHCLIRHVKDVSHFPEWFDRISSVTRREILQIVGRCHSAGLIDAHVRDALIEFIEYRQSRIRSFIDRTKDQFISADEWTLDLEGVDGGN